MNNIYIEKYLEVSDMQYKLIFKSCRKNQQDATV